MRLVGGRVSAHADRVERVPGQDHRFRSSIRARFRWCRRLARRPDRVTDVRPRPASLMSAVDVRSPLRLLHFVAVQRRGTVAPTGPGPLSVPLASLPGGVRPVREPSRSAVKGGGHKGPREPPRDYVPGRRSPPPSSSMRPAVGTSTETAVRGRLPHSSPGGIRRSALSASPTCPWASTVIGVARPLAVTSQARTCSVNGPLPGPSSLGAVRFK